MPACAWGGGQARLPNSEAHRRCLRQRVLCHACQVHAGTGSSGGIRTTDSDGDLWLLERAGLVRRDHHRGVKEDTEDMDNTEVVENIEDMEDMKDMEDMEDTVRGWHGRRGGHGSCGGQEGSNINNIVTLCNISTPLLKNIGCFNDI